MTAPTATSRLRRDDRLTAALSTAVAILAAVALTAAPAAAAPTPSPSGSQAPSATAPKPGSITWSVMPSNAQGDDERSSFTYNNLKPGTVVHDYVGVTNYSKTPVTFQVYASDAFGTSTGSIDLLAASAKPIDVGAWIALKRTTITVPPSARVNEPFTLTVPSNATPGDHTGGLIASVSVTTTNSSGAKVTVDRRLAAPVFLRVSGPLHPALSIESLSAGGYQDTVNPFGGGASTVSYTIHNTGNVRLDAAQLVKVTGPFGITLATSRPKPLADLLPGASLRITQKVHGVFPAGPLTVRVRLAPAQVKGALPGSAGPVSVETASMWATPWSQLTLLLLIVALAFGWRWLRRHRRQRMDDRVADAVARARRETVAELGRRDGEKVGAAADASQGSVA